MTSKLVGTALLAISLTGATMAQSAKDQTAAQTPASQAPAITIPLSAGTAINATLVGAIDSSRSKPGDPVTATVSESVVYQRTVLVPKGSRIVGHVVRTGGDSESSALFVEFDRVILQDGQQAVLNAGIQALAPPNAAPTIPSRKEYEENWVAGRVRNEPAIPSAAGGTAVVPSTYTTPRRSVVPDVDAQQIEGGLDHQGRFTPDSKGAFAEPNMKVFTPVSEGSHGTVLVGTKRSVRLASGTHLLIVIQPPASSPAPSPDVR